MDKRSEARQKRINEVLEHKNIVDLSESLRQLRSIERKVNVLYKLNIRYACAKMDVNCLLQNGWQRVSAKPEEENLSRLWLPGVCWGQGVCLVLSADDEWLALYCGDTFSKCPWECKMPLEQARILEKGVQSAVKRLPPQSIEEEHQACLENCPPLFTVKGKAVDIKELSFSSLWSRIQHYWKEAEPYHSIAYVFSLLRHQDEKEGRFQWLAMDLVTLGERFNVDAWKAIACLFLLECEPDGCICTHYYSLVSTLVHWKMFQPALYCSYVCWLYAPGVSFSSFKRLLAMMRLVLGQMLSKRKIDGIERILSEMDYIKEKYEVSEISIEMMYYRALLAVRGNECEKARKLLVKASSSLQKVGEESKSEREMELSLAVRACRELLAQGDSKKLRRNYLNYYPAIPGRDLWKGTELPEAFLYPGHGTHWHAVFGHEELEEEMMKLFSQWSKFSPATDYPSGISKGIDASIYRLFHYKENENTPLEVEAIVSIGADNKKEPSNRVTTLFPAMATGKAGRMMAKACGFAFDDANYEFLMELELPHGTIEFFFIPDIPEEYDVLLENKEYPLELSAWGYSLTKLKPFEIEVEVPKGKKGKSTMEKLHVNESLRNLTNTPYGYRDDIDFVARIASIKKITFLGNPMLWILLEFDERAWNLNLPLVINVNSVAEGYEPKVGDVVEGAAWLQGRLVDDDEDDDDDEDED